MRYLFIICIILVCCKSQAPETGLLPVPDHFPTFNIIVGNSSSFDGYIFLRETKSPGGQLMINSTGEIVWFQVSDTTILRVHTPYDQSYLSLKSKREINEISYNGDTLLKLRYGDQGFDRELHHEIIFTRDGDILALTHESFPMDLSSVGGSENDTLGTDGIMKLSRNGDKLWSWHPLNIVDPLDFPDVARKKKDWGHANSLHEDVDGNYLISWRDFNEVWKVNSSTGELMWRYGANTVDLEEDKIFQQHSVNRSQGGDYLIFDNGHPRLRKYSRAYGFNTVDGEGQLRSTFKVNLPDSLFSFKQGSVFEFEKDRFLFSSTMTGTIIIVDKNGEIQWMAKSDHGFYRAYYLPKDVLSI